MSYSELARQIGEGDPKAFVELLRGLGAQLHAVARGILGQESLAAAAVSEVFVELISRPVRLQTARLAANAVLLLDVRSHSLDRRLRSQRALQGSGEKPPAREVDRGSPATKALQGLPHAERVLLENLYWAGRARRESAAELDLEPVEARRRGVRALIAFGVRLGVPKIAALDVLSGEGEREAEVVLRELEEQAGEADTAVDLQPFGMDEELRLALLEAFARIGETVAPVRLPLELERKLARAFAGEAGVLALGEALSEGEVTQPAQATRSGPELPQADPDAGAAASVSGRRRASSVFKTAAAVLGWLLALGFAGAWLYWDSELRAERSRAQAAISRREEEAQKNLNEVQALREELEALRELFSWLGSPSLQVVTLRPSLREVQGPATLLLAGAQGWRLIPSAGSRLGTEPLELEFWVAGEPTVVVAERVEAGNLVWFQGARPPSGLESVAVYRRLQLGEGQARLRLLEGNVAEPRRR